MTDSKSCPAPPESLRVRSIERPHKGRQEGQGSHRHQPDPASESGPVSLYPPQSRECPLVQVGDTLELQITGLLRIRNGRQEAVFDTTVTVVSETELQGQASTTIRWRDYSLRIPSWPGGGWVADGVILELFFDAARSVARDSDKHVRHVERGTLHLRL